MSDIVQEIVDLVMEMIENAHKDDEETASGPGRQDA